MNYRVVGKYLGKMLALDGACMIPALLIALFRWEKAAFFSFLVAIALQALCSFGLISIRTSDNRLYAKEGVSIVALSWIVISLFGALPFFFSGEIPSFMDAVFETVSGFTTTGASILSDVEALPMSLLYWRSFTHFLGGMGVLVLVLALAPSDGGSGMPLHILRAESPGPVVGKLAPKLHLTARILYAIYVAMTIILIILLLCGGMSFMEALLTSFGTAGTGGFGIKNDSIASYSPYVQTVVGVFMILFGVNFSIYFLALAGDFKSILKNSELKLYLFFIATSTALITFFTKNIFGSLGETIRHAFFQVSSIITTTGFTTTDFNTWPEYAHIILLFLMFSGACAGSTGGGFKVVRLIILSRFAKADLKKLTHPKSVSVVKMDGKPLGKGTIERCASFLFWYVLIFMISVLVVSFDGFSFKTTVSAVMACLNNIGPGLDAVGPTSNFGGLSNLSKIVLAFDMLFGRLEILPLLLLFMPSTWRKNK